MKHNRQWPNAEQFFHWIDWNKMKKPIIIGDSIISYIFFVCRWVVRKCYFFIFWQQLMRYSVSSVGCRLVCGAHNTGSCNSSEELHLADVHFTGITIWHSNRSRVRFWSKIKRTQISSEWFYLLVSRMLRVIVCNRDLTEKIQFKIQQW